MSQLLRFLFWNVSLSFIAIVVGCGGGNSFSGNATPLNFTGFYDVRRTNPTEIAHTRISEITLTQTNNFARAIDNNGVIYEGSVNITSITLFNARDEASEGEDTIGTGSSGVDGYNVTQTYTLAGVTREGRPVSLHLIAQFVYETTLEYHQPVYGEDGSIVTPGYTDAFTPSNAQGNIQEKNVRLVALQGNYVETGGLAGTIIFQTNFS